MQLDSAGLGVLLRPQPGPPRSSTWPASTAPTRTSTPPRPSRSTRSARAPTPSPRSRRPARARPAGRSWDVLAPARRPLWVTFETYRAQRDPGPGAAQLAGDSDVVGDLSALVDHTLPAGSEHDPASETRCASRSRSRSNTVGRVERPPIDFDHHALRGEGEVDLDPTDRGWKAHPSSRYLANKRAIAGSRMLSGGLSPSTSAASASSSARMPRCPRPRCRSSAARTTAGVVARSMRNDSRTTGDDVSSEAPTSVSTRSGLVVGMPRRTEGRRSTRSRGRCTTAPASRIGAREVVISSTGCSPTIGAPHR